MPKKCSPTKENCRKVENRLAPLARLARTLPYSNTSHGTARFLKTEDTSAHNEPWLTPKEASAHLGISLGSLRNKVSNGLIPRHKLGRLNRFLRSELDGLLLKKA